MGKKTPAQRRKTRQPGKKTSRHVANKHARKISIGNEHIKEAWDTHATMKENYERLGLAADPNKAIASNPSSIVDSSLIQQIEQLANNATKAERHQSEGEIKFIEAMIKKHGDDVEAMAYDLKMNPFQLTAAELKRKLVRYNNERKKSGEAMES